MGDPSGGAVLMRHLSPLAFRLRAFPPHPSTGLRTLCWTRSGSSSTCGRCPHDAGGGTVRPSSGVGGPEGVLLGTVYPLTAFSWPVWRGNQNHSRSSRTALHVWPLRRILILVISAHGFRVDPRLQSSSILFPSRITGGRSVETEGDSARGEQRAVSEGDSDYSPTSGQMR